LRVSLPFVPRARIITARIIILRIMAMHATVYAFAGTLLKKALVRRQKAEPGVAAALA
jgi:hypothetical protein